MKFAEMTFPELAEVSRMETVVLVPIAACEQHSLHLATITDTVLVTGVADGVEARLREKVLQLPTLWLGASHHHLRFGATLSVDADTHATLLAELLQPILEENFDRILILNGHGGNIDTMQVALRVLQPHYPETILAAASYWDLAAPELAALAEGPRKSMGHACEFETSMMLHLRPDLVRRDQIKDDPEKTDPKLRGLYLCEDMYQRTDHGCVGYPQLASAEKGKRFLEVAIDRTVAVIEALLERPLPG
jgi:creatinine amidohydrolase